MKFLVTSDFHGNHEHVNELQQIVAIHKPDAFFYVGDLSPGRWIFDTPESASKYLETKFFPVIRALPVKHKYVMPGNTDFITISKAFQEKYQDPAECKFMMDSSLQLEQFNLVFLSTVDYSTHCLKDTEAINKFETNKSRLNQSYKESHVFSRDTPGEVSKVVVGSDSLRYDLKYFEVFPNYHAITEPYKSRLNYSIYDRLKNLIDGRPNTIVFSHSPPFNTCADMVSRKNNLHCGSMDVRKAVEDFHPLAVFSGHIHQSVICSGKFRDKINETDIFTTGNTGIDVKYLNKIAVVVYDTETKEAERFVYDLKGEFEYTLDRIYE
ncbi:Calcineurin-like_phosphoesterase [Hexamita inflata]|uniref:Calcineurin-like phosphoesterase n=1 Tax=Hexamita inflata TaxID=28002 RepID=A0AA86RB54_9EUKA|nr:Calcineurin-like phosphoesterase [Hexamita inflata]